MKPGAKTQVIYWTGQVYNDSASEIDAVISEQFTSPLVEKCTDYVLAIERFEVNLNGVPYYDKSAQNDTIIFTYVIGGVNTVVVILLTDNTIEREIYSLLQLLDEINALIGANLLLATAGMSINMDDYGYIYFSWTNVNVTAMDIAVNDHLNEYIGFESTTGIIQANGGYLYSTYPRFDTGDLCEHVRIVSNLMLVSDTSGQAKTNIVTDVGAISSYSTSHAGLPGNGGQTTFSLSQRQKLCYQPAQRRWLNFAAPVALTYISIWAEYVRPDGESVTISLPRGAMFAIKLGFYYRQ